MDWIATYIPYRQTGSFSNIVLDYIESKEALLPFYEHKVSLRGIKAAIEERKKYTTDRQLLVHELQKNYAGIDTTEKVKANIGHLLSENTFTITTAHQPNIFTGHLYFIYKIIHAIKLADELNNEIKDCHFVPVYYIGSEDADLEELGEVTLDGKKYQWKTQQQGAVGRMKVDNYFMEMIHEIEGQLSVEKFGNEILTLVKAAYTPGKTIEQATFELVNSLFADKGLLILLPDNAALKSISKSINDKELATQFSHKAVAETIAAFPETYKVQAAGRDINLFYLKDDSRERIESSSAGFSVANTSTSFTRDEMANELNEHPERFSPNVILRPVFQEMILPNIVFIGGGGELAYWLELKKVFQEVQVPYPVLVLRNSFMIINQKNKEQRTKLSLSLPDLFKPSQQLIEEMVQRESSLILQLEKEKEGFRLLYHQVSTLAAAIDTTLKNHVAALCSQALKKIEVLEKKMMKAEKKKFEASQRQVNKIKAALFPGGTLQERVDNLLPYYALWGKQFLDLLYERSHGLAQEFCVLEEQ